MRLMSSAVKRTISDNAKSDVTPFDNRTIPAYTYYDPAVYELELQHLFQHAWYLAGPLEQLAEPGDYLTCEAVQVPIVVTRDLEGELRGFVNVCRHRFHKVAQGKGNRNALTCGYHGWTYELDGRLRSAPGSERERRFNKCDIALRPVAVDTWKGFVFVNPDPDANPFLESYPALDEITSKWRFDLSEYLYWDRFVSTMTVNWKLCFENAVECYHCPLVHPGLDQYLEMDLRCSEYFSDGRLLASLCPTSPVTKEQRPLGDSEFGYRNFFLWPAIFFSQDEYLGFTLQFSPTGPDSCQMIADGYYNPDVDKEFLDDLFQMWDKAFQEDVDVSNRVGEGLWAGIEQGYLLSESDKLVLDHQRLYRQIMGKHLSAQGKS